MDDARALLAEAEELEAHEPALARLATNLDWMRGALGVLRGAERAPKRGLARLILLKYAACAACALLASACALLGLAAPFAPWVAPWAALALASVGFYAVEAQLVFLVPLAIDGEARPWSTSIAWTRGAGGTARVLVTVLPIAAYMLAGAFVRRGAARSWRVGCLAVLLWYERVRLERVERLRREQAVGA